MFIITKNNSCYSNNSFDPFDETINYLQFLKQSGCRGFECSGKSLEIIKSWGQSLSKPDTLESILTDLGDCQRCRLSETRKKIVFGKGDANARVVFVGECPGFEEDENGEPFVGTAGILLTKIIQAMNLTRETVYICNIVKCRPPNNRNPMIDEINTCIPYVKRQIAAINPDIICLLGSCAAQSILEVKDPISQIRGNFFSIDGIIALPTYHPADLLRNPDKKRDVWEDMKKLIKKLETI